MLGFSKDKYLCGCACLYFSDLLAYGYAVMMLNVLRFNITIKNLTNMCSGAQTFLCEHEGA